MPDQRRSTFQMHHNSIPNTTINTNTSTTTNTSPSTGHSSKYYETKLHVHQPHGVTSQSCLPTSSSSSATTTYTTYHGDHSPPHHNLPHQQQHMYFSNQQQCLSSISPNQEELRLPPIQYLLSQPNNNNNSIKANPTTITGIHNPSPLDLHVDQVYQLFNTSNISACTKTSTTTKSVNNMYEPVPFQNHQPLSSHAPNATRLSLKSDNMHVVVNGTSNHHVHVDVVNASSSSHMSINGKNENNKNSTDTCVVNGKSPALTCQPPTTSVLESAIDMGSDSEPQHHDERPEEDLKNIQLKAVVGSIPKERKDQGYLSTSSFEGDENTAFNPERTKLACSVCRIAKKKCDGKDPCDRCSRLGKECTFAKTTGKTRGRPKKHSMEGLANQLHFHGNSFQENQQQPRSKKKKSSNEEIRIL